MFLTTPGARPLAPDKNTGDKISAQFSCPRIVTKRAMRIHAALFMLAAAGAQDVPRPTRLRIYEVRTALRFDEGELGAARCPTSRRRRGGRRRGSTRATSPR